MNGDEREKKRELYGWAIIPSSSLFLRLDSSLAHPSSVPFTSVSLSLLLWLSLLWDNKIWHESQREREGERIWDGYFSCLHSIPSLSLSISTSIPASPIWMRQWSGKWEWDEVNGFHARLLSSLSWPGLTVHTHPFLASLVDKEAWHGKRDEVKGREE